jgi:hypothetical protein
MVCSDFGGSALLPVNYGAGEAAKRFQRETVVRQEADKYRIVIHTVRDVFT